MQGTHPIPLNVSKLSMVRPPAPSVRVSASTRWGALFGAWLVLAACGELGPAAPADLSALVRSGQVSLRWTPADERAVSYQVSYGEQISDQKTFHVEAPADGCLITGLTNGRSYSFALVARDAQGRSSRPSNTVTVKVGPSAEGPPAILEMTPADGATEVVTSGGQVAITFSESMDPSRFSLTSDPPIVFGAPIWGLDETLVTLPFGAALPFNKSYTLHVSGVDLSGETLVEKVDFHFSTPASADKTPPQLASTIPENGNTTVPIVRATPPARLSVTFDEAMDASTVKVTTEPPLELGPAAWDVEGRVAAFPTVPVFTYNTVYVVKVEGRDLSGNPLSAGTQFSFTTVNPPDTTPPSVVATQPAAGATVVSPKTKVSIQFDGKMKRATVALTLSPAKAGTMAWDSTDKLLTFTPSTPLAESTLHTVTIAAGAQDAAGNPMGAFSFNFTTGTVAEFEAPTVASASPATGSLGNARRPTLRVNFSEAMDKASTQAALTITQPAGFDMTKGAFLWSNGDKTVSYTPDVVFPYGTVVEWRLATTAEDLSQNKLQAGFTRTFTVRRLTTVSLAPTPALDGYLSNTGTANATGVSYSVGDTATGQSLRAFLSFDLTPLPEDLLGFTAVTFKVTQSSVAGAPFGVSALGDLLVESVDYGPTLAADDFNRPVLQVFNATTGMFEDLRKVLSTTPAAGLRTVDQRVKVNEDWIKRGTLGKRSQFRLRFTNAVLNNVPTALADQVVIPSVEATANRPSLDISYEHP